jgi:hypothetical protein
MNDQEIIEWKLDRVLHTLEGLFVLTLLLGISILVLTISGISSIGKRIEKLESSISVMSEPPQKTKAQLYLEKFGDHE